MYSYNNVITWTDIIGDPRKLQDRVEYTVTSTDEQIDIHKNMYILCNDSSNNSGEVGHLYRYLGSDITNVHTNSTDGDSNVSGGHIDFSVTDAWLDLGTDLTIGGYKDEWLQKGFAGTPLTVGENGESLLPIDRPKNYDGYYGGDFRAIKIKMSKKYSGSDYHYNTTVLVSKKDGTFLKYNPNGGYGELQYFFDYINNAIGLNTLNSYSDLGYSSEQEMLDLMKVIVTYETKANNMELADNSEVINLDNNTALFGNNSLSNGVILLQNLINKVGIDNYNSYLANQKLNLSNFRLQCVGDKKFFNTANSILENSTYEEIPAENTPAIKVIPYLTQQNNRAYLQYVFKEIKYDSSSNTFGDDNKFQIVDKVSTTTDTNGNTILIGQKRIPLNCFIPKED